MPGIENRSSGADGTSTRHRSKLRRAPSETDGTAEVRHALNPHPFREAEMSTVTVPELWGRLRAGSPLSDALNVWASRAIKHQRRPHALHGPFGLRHAVAARARLFRQLRRLGRRFVPFPSDRFGTAGPVPCASDRSGNHDSSHPESSSSELPLGSCGRRRELR